MSVAPGPAAADSDVRRLFFALQPADEIREELARIARKALRKRGRLVPAENLHMTLIFLGPVSGEQRQRAEQAAAGITGPAFELALDHLGHFPRPRVLWSAPSETPQTLVDLATRLRTALTECGFAPETRPFKAHLTVARKVAAPVAGVAHDPVRWPVTAFHLMESRTLPAGARYTSLASWPLRGTLDENS